MDHIGDYGHCEPKNIFKPGGLNVGTSIIDDLYNSETKAWLSDWHHSVEHNWSAMAQAAADSETTFLFMYDPSLDGWLHEHTRESAQLPARLSDIRQQIDRVLAIARQHHDEVRFHIWSDHGMCTIRQHLDVQPLLAKTGLRMHEDYHCVIDSTMVRCWYHGDKAKRQRVRECLGQQHGLSLVSQRS